MINYTSYKMHEVLLSSEKSDLPLDSGAKNVMKSHHFDSRLDSYYLKQFYLDDLELANSMFHIFLKKSIREYNKIYEALEKENWDFAKSICHKVSPSFMLVGLTYHAKLLHKVQDHIDTKSYQKAADFYKLLEILMESYLPIVKYEANQLKKLHSLK